VPTWDLTDPEVYEELLRWGRWYLAQTGVNGFRLDAIKHMSRSFYLRWLSDLRESAEGELFCVGRVLVTARGRSRGLSR